MIFVSVFQPPVKAVTRSVHRPDGDSKRCREYRSELRSPPERVRGLATHDRAERGRWKSRPSCHIFRLSGWWVAIGPCHADNGIDRCSSIETIEPDHCERRHSAATARARSFAGDRAASQHRRLRSPGRAGARGVIRPLILLPPAALCGWSVEQLEMVLLHELAHLRRWGNLINIVQRVVESLLFFHPVVWWLSGWLRLERELCCDRLVVGRPADRGVCRDAGGSGRVKPSGASGRACDGRSPGLDPGSSAFEFRGPVHETDHAGRTRLAGRFDRRHIARVRLGGSGRWEG